MQQYPCMDFKAPRKFVISRSTVTLIGVLLLWCLTTYDSVLPVAPGASGIHGTYATKFSLTEDPVSEGGNWVNGKYLGIDWTNVRTTSGLAVGTESGTGGFDDSTALLTGTWGPDQAAQATVRSVSPSDDVFEEVELRLRSSISAHRNTGYEINFRCSKTSNAYMEIVRWNGSLGNFSYVSKGVGSQYGVANGDVVKATMIGNVITVYINGMRKLRVIDNTYTSGNPGLGFYLQGSSGMNADYGFTTFMATDGSTTQSPIAPSILSTTAN